MTTIDVIQRMREADRHLLRAFDAIRFVTPDTTGTAYRAKVRIAKARTELTRGIRQLDASRKPGVHV